MEWQIQHKYYCRHSLRMTYTSHILQLSFNRMTYTSLMRIVQNIDQEMPSFINTVTRFFDVIQECNYLIIPIQHNNLLILWCDGSWDVTATNTVAPSPEHIILCSWSGDQRQGSEIYIEINCNHQSFLITYEMFGPINQVCLARSDLVKALAAPTHVLCAGGQGSIQLVCRWVTTTENCGVEACGREMVTCGSCSRRRKLPHVVS